MTEEPTNAAIAAWRAAGIPMRFQNCMSDDDLLGRCLAQARPEGRVQRWSELFRQGEILRSLSARTCGLGLWLTGGFSADFIGAAVMQSLILRGHVESAYYTNVHQLLEDSSPDGDGTAGNVDRDLLLVQGIGEHYVAASNWSSTTIHAILRSRLDDGLPTIVTSPKPARASLLPEGFVTQAFYEVHVGEVHRV